MVLRTSLPVQPHLYIGDAAGRPLDYGRVYFGEPDKDPEFYPIDIYYDEALTIAAVQPVRTKGGFMDANGDMVEIYANEIVYSVKVLDNYGVQVFYKARMTKTSTDSSVSTQLPYPDSIERTQAAKNADLISITDFGAVAGGIIDSTSAINSATSSGLSFVPAGDYKADESLIDRSKLYGAGSINGVKVGYQLGARISIKDFGAVGDGVTNDSQSIKNAINSKLPLFAPYGNYLCEGVSFNDIAGVDIEGDIKRPTFTMPKAAADTGADMFKFLTTDIRSATLATRIIPNQSYIDFVSASTISVGDTIQVVSSNFWKYDPRGLYYAGEIHRVTRVDGNRVYIADFTRDTYELAAIQSVQVWTPSTINISNIIIDIPLAAHGQSTVGIHHDGGLNDSFHNVTVKGATFCGILTSRSIDTQITNIHGEDIGYPDANGYVVQDRGGLGTRMSGISSVSSRKLFDASSNSGANSSVCRDWSIDDFDVKGGGRYYPVAADTEQNYGIGTHGSSDNGRISNGTIADTFIGINPRGRNLTVDNVTFKGRVNTCFEGTFGAGLTVNNCKGDGDIGTFITLSNPSGTGDWDFSLPVDITGNTVNGLKTAFVNFAGPRTNIINFYARNNRALSNNTSGDACVMFKCVNQYLSKSALDNNLIRADVGFISPIMYSSGLSIGYHETDKECSVYMGGNTHAVTVLNNTVARIPRFARNNGSRPIVTVAADSGGFAVFVMRPANATLTPVSSSISGFEGNADGASLTGTTGTSGVQTFALDSSGNLYIENRTGSTKNYRVSST